MPPVRTFMKLQFRFSQRQIFPILLVLITTACVRQPPPTLALQCISGSAQWSPLTLDFANSRIGGHPATITDSHVRWETVNRNGFGGATHTLYGLNRGSGLVTVDSVYVDSHGNRGIEPNPYAGECYVRHSRF